MDEASIKAIALTQLWLDTDGAGVTAEELKATADAAHAPASAAAYTVYVANAAVYAAYPTYAANAAAYAAAIAANATNRDEKLSQYKTYLLKMVDELTELERLIYDLNMEVI